MPKVIKKGKFSRPTVNDILLAGKQRSNDISNYNNYTSNDNTQVNNVVRKKYNTNRDKYLEPGNKIGGYRALKTTAGKIGTALGAVPISVAGVPALGALGEVAAPTVAKVAGSLGGKLIGAGLTSAGLASGINDVSKGEYHWYTPLDLAPGVGMALNGANKTIKAYNTIKNIKQEENINKLNLFRRNEKIGNLAGKARGINNDLKNEIYRLQDNFRRGKHKYFEEAIAKQDKKLDKIADNIRYMETMGDDEAMSLADKFDNYKFERFRNLYYKRSPKYDGINVYDDNALFKSDRVKTSPDLRKASTENIKKFINEHYISPKQFEVLSDEFGRPFIKSHNGGNNVFTTGDIELTDFTTGKKYQFNIPNNGSKQSIIKPNFDYFGSNTTSNTEPWHLIESNDRSIKKVDIPQQYKEILQRNMEFLKNQYLGGNAKGFGSVNSVIYHDLPHGTHDYDFITTSDRLKNIQGKRIKNNGGYKKQIQSDEYGPLDINVIDAGKNGGAKNELAHEIYKELYPEKYKKFISEHINDKNVTDLELPISPEDLYQAYDEKNKSFIDMFLSNNPKHVGRFINQLNAGDTDDIVRGMEKYNEIMTGGDFKSSNIPLSEFEDSARNEEILRRLGVNSKTILNENILNNPKKTKAVVDRIIVDKSYLGRGIHTRYSDDKVKDLLVWNPDTRGGTVHGAKLNTVQGGDSTHGDLYTFIRPKQFKNPKDIKSVDDIINFENYNVGIRRLNDNEIKLAKDIAEKHNVILNNPKTLQDLLIATENKKGLNIKNYLEEISDKLDVPAIQNGYYEVSGNSNTAPNFVSILKDQELPSIKQYFINDADRPTTLINKSNKVGDTSDKSPSDLSILNAIWDVNTNTGHMDIKKLREIENTSTDDMQLKFFNKFENDYDKKVKLANKRLAKELTDLKNSYEIKKAKPIRKIQMSKRVEKKIDNLNGIIKNNNNRLLKLNNKVTENSNNYSRYLVRSNNYRDELKNRITRNILGSSAIGTALGIEYLNNKNSHKHMRNRKKYAGGGKVPPAAAPVRLQINPTNLPLPFTNNEPVMPLMKGWELRSKLMKERSIAEYQDWLNKADPQIINAVRKMKNTKEPLTPYLKAWTPEQKETLRREYEIKKENNSDETPYYEYGVKNDLIPGATCINTSTAAHGEAHPSNIDFAENYKKYGYKRVDVNEMQPGDIIQLSTGGVPTHAMMATSTFDPIYKTFKTSQSHGGHAPSQMEHGKIFTIDPYQAQIRAAREDIKKGKKVDIKSLENDTRELPANIYHYLTPEGIMLYRKIPTTNNKNIYKFGGDVKATPKRKHENNYIMKGTGTYVPKTPQEKVVVNLYNANYKSARRNMPREDALRQAHYRTTQQMMESGYGTSKQARKQNNYGGMGGSNSYNYKTINDFTDHVDTTMFKNFKNSYKAPTLKSYINGLYNGRIGTYSETPIEIYDKEFRGTHPRTSKIIEQLNPDDYTMLDTMYNPYGNTNLMYAKYGCKVRPKAWIGAAISAVAGIASSLINANAQKKAAARQARAQEAAENRKYATDLTTQLNNSSADDTQFYDQFKTEFKNGGKVKGYNARITDGGIAIPIGRDTSLLRGSLHNEINEAGNTGIGIKYGNNEVEAQDGEIVRKKKDKLLVYSNEDELGNGISPAKRVLRGENKDKVFAMQENNKRQKGIVNNNKTFLTGGHMTFTKGDAYGAAANAAGNIASFFINNNAINKMSAGKAPILVSPTKLNTVYNANAQLADINKSRLRMKNAITRNSSSSVAALGRLNDIENSAIDKVNQIYENKNNVESQLMNQDRMNAQSVRLQNAAKMDEYNRRVAEINNQKHLAKAQNVTSLINGLAGAAEQTINNAEERYYKDKNLEIAAAPYDDETTSRLLEIEGAVPENRIVEIYLRNKDSQDPKKKALAELAFRRMSNFDNSSKYNSYINQEYRNKAKLIGNNGYKVPTLGNINTNIRLNGETPYYTNPLITRMLNRNNDFISYMNGYRY